MRAFTWFAWMLVIVLAVGGARACSASRPAPVPAAADASAVLACREFAALRRDADAGIVAEAETRPRVQALYANARLADAARAPDVQAAAAGLLVSATVPGQRDAGAVARLEAACQSAVWDRGAR